MTNNFSINTNVGAQVALQSLNSIQTNLNKVQNEVSTGESVAGATDNAAVFAVAQGVRSNLAAYSSVSTALNDGQSLNAVAVNGATAVSNLLTNITQSLTELSDGSISDAQRQTYTANLKAQIDEVQTFISGSTYNGINLLAGNQGTFAVSAGGASNFSAPTNVSVLSGLNGVSLTIHATDLEGGTAGTDGFLGLARLVYNVGSATNAAVNTANDTNSNAVLLAGTSGLISRSEINQNEALAALAAVSASASAFQSVAGAAGTTSVFGASLANFTNQVNNALGQLGADNNNIQLQITFVQSLSDAANTGLGNLVDANLAQASAQLTALQTQQQLATQALSIANSQPQNILNLFKGS
jgi:flagellin